MGEGGGGPEIFHSLRFNSPSLEFLEVCMRIRSTKVHWYLSMCDFRCPERISNCILFIPVHAVFSVVHKFGVL